MSRSAPGALTRRVCRSRPTPPAPRPLPLLLPTWSLSSRSSNHTASIVASLHSPLVNDRVGRRNTWNALHRTRERSESGVDRRHVIVVRAAEPGVFDPLAVWIEAGVDERC